MKVALYCRVGRGGSEESQKEAIFNQRRILERFAQNNNFQIIGSYEDVGFPGYILKRPGLTKLCDAFDRGEFEAVLVVKRDHLFRGTPTVEPKWPFRVYTLSQREHQHER